MKNKSQKEIYFSSPGYFIKFSFCSKSHNNVRLWNNFKTC